MASGDKVALESHDADWFQFPFQAYPIQVDLMNAVYRVIDQRQIGLLESPTGTGKSLSLLCGAMKWLRDHQGDPLVLELEASEVVEETRTDLPAWAVGYQTKRKEDEKAWKRKEHQRIQEAYQTRLRKLRFTHGDGTHKEQNSDGIPEAKRRKVVVPFQTSRFASGSSSLQTAPNHVEPDSSQANQDEFLLDDYDSDHEKARSYEDEEPAPTRSTPSAALKEEKDLSEYPTRKIFFCSRTHSQLSQFIQECRKTHWANDLRLVVLGSRKTMCINPVVNKLATSNQINDKCLDMISSKPVGLKDGTGAQGTSSSESVASEFNAAFGLVPKESQASLCKFLHEQRQRIFRDLILALPKDIEELMEIGKEGVECPYFATRSSIQNAELVVLPYNTLLHAGTREALGIDLRGSIVIMDEAHNLIDTVNAIHSVELTLGKMSQALSQLTLYLDKYSKRLKPKNIAYIEKVSSILRALLKYLDPPTASIPSNSAKGNDSNEATPAPSSSTTGENKDAFETGISTSIVQLNDFLFDSQLDTHNLFKIEKYLKESDIIHKVQGFCQSAQVEISVVKQKKTIRIELDESEFEKHRPALGQVAQFLATLTTKGSDACLLVTRHRAPSNPKHSSIKYILLNPEIQFQSILQEARSVILAGGTLQPFGDFYQHLLISDEKSRIPSTSDIDNTVSTIFTGENAIRTTTENKTLSGMERITTFTCSHIVPDSNLLCLTFSTGPTEVEFNFTYETRHQSNAMFDDVAKMFGNFCNVVPDGIVLFSPSYQFEEALISRWKTTGAYDLIAGKKPIFREPRTTSGVDAILAEYERCILKNDGSPGCVNGAVLSCVVGGKLSEGINFKDHLGRLVVVLGLPFPNARDPVLMERLAHINHKLKTAQPSASPTSGSAASSAEYYENLCMKAVNQSIGRSIRHIGDYACIVLLDKRYSKPSIASKLPQWIRRRLAHTTSFGDGFKQVVQFFRGKASNQLAIQETRQKGE